jgi:hypothetical protein
MVCSILKTTGLIDKYALFPTPAIQFPVVGLYSVHASKIRSARRLRGAGPSSHIKGCSLGTPYPLLE